MVFFEEAALPFWIFSDAPPLTLDNTTGAVISWAPNLQHREGELHKGFRLVHNYKFLTGLDVGVMLTSVSPSSHGNDMQFQHCICVSTKGSPSKPQAFTSREKKMSTCSRTPKQRLLGMEVESPSHLTVLCVLFGCVTVPFCVLSEIPEGKTTTYFSAS